MILQIPEDYYEDSCTVSGSDLMNNPDAIRETAQMLVNKKECKDWLTSKSLWLGSYKVKCDITVSSGELGDKIVTIRVKKKEKQEDE